ncbi:hypothetical protein COLO4_04862 [Corchorus olitorius]|uniref:Uncharacterized protein n=1 Tax=Corchorus olitorius TaxID=93759 RepID=A0A1R3KSK1_9ROSI|nr:hypothetical protein COLO4_04862 [Corchorus olitorius]
MASITMAASFVSSSSIIHHGQRRLVVANASKVESVKLSGETESKRQGNNGNGRRELILAAAAAAVSSVAAGIGVAAAEGPPKAGTPEAKKFYASVCVTMPTAKAKTSPLDHFPTKQIPKALKDSMEALHHYDTSWSSSTSWSIADGSLLTSVTFESSFAPITDSTEHEHHLDDPNAVDSTPKSPLILCPNSPDSGPCEITITFAQKHEIRQVYVRSTARVYEIYYAPKPQSSNEYLCTVRCGIACRNDEVLHAATLDESSLAHQKGTNKELDERRPKNDSNSSSNEDDWVEVKAPDTPLLDSGSSVPAKFSVNSISTQDLYEATAEITDASPCMSITLRLLSLQNKGCVCVDELYVFADPVESADSENEVGQVGNASGSSLMAMLAPTFLQLSKTAELRRIQNENISGAREKEKTRENGSKAIEAPTFANELPREGKSNLANQQDVELQEASTAIIGPNLHEIPPQLKDKEAKADASCGHIERILDQLVCRVSRVEDLLLKFEEKIMKPISSIDARLQNVELQLEELTKKPKNSEFPSCTRYAAPEFSCHDSDNYSPRNIGNESSSQELYASRENDFSSSIQHDEMVYSVDATQSFPSLVVSAPEFSTGDDEEDDHASGTSSPKDKPKQTSGTGSPKEKPKQTMSIDDALASALSSFLSSTSVEPQKYTQALVFKAPDFSNEEDGSSDKKVSPKSLSGVTSEPCCLDRREGMNSATASVSSNCPSERIVEASCSLNDNHSEEGAMKVGEDCQVKSTSHDTFDCTTSQGSHEVHQIADEVGNGEVSSGTSKTLVLDEAVILNEFLENHVEEGSDTDADGVVRNTETEAELTEQGPQREIVQNVLELSYASSVVDFETPILDVKFTSLGNSNDKSPLEYLLSDMLVMDKGASCSKENVDGSQAGEECDLIPVGDEEPAGAAIDGHFSFDFDSDGLSNMPLNLELEVENVEEHPAAACSNQELLRASLI